MISVISDHGHALGEHGATGKPYWALWPELTDVPFIIRHPGGKKAGETSDHYASTHDVTTTVLGALGIEPPYAMDGQDLSALFDGKDLPQRSYFAGGQHDYVWARDDDHALICRNDGSGAKLYDLREDPGQQENVAWRNGDVAKRMFQDYVVKDAGGEPLPNYDV
jgi:arylsulfatase A-like enzyme